MVKAVITLPHNFTEDNANGNTVNFTGMDLDDNFNACKTEVERLDSLINEKISNLSSSKTIIADKLTLDDVDDNLFSVNTRYYDVTGQGYTLADGFTIKVRLTIDHTFQPRAKPRLKLDNNEYKYIVYHNQTSLSEGTTETIYYIDGNSFSSGINTFTYDLANDVWVWKGQVASGMLIPMSYQNSKIPIRLHAGWVALTDPNIEIDSAYADEHPYFSTWYSSTPQVNFSISGLWNGSQDKLRVGKTYPALAGAGGVKGSFTLKEPSTFNGTYYWFNDFAHNFTNTRTTTDTHFSSPELINYNNISVLRQEITYTPPQPVLKASLSETKEAFITKRFGVDWWLKT